MALYFSEIQKLFLFLFLFTNDGLISAQINIK